jgi:hypothetical protein
MCPSDLLFAAMLLSAPMGTPEAAPTPERWPAVRDALHQTAVDWEILDSRERRYVLTKREDFQDDLDFLRKRRAELAEAPRVAEAERLPDRLTINDCIRFNRSFRKNMEIRSAWESDRADFIREVIDENERLYKIWDAIRDAKSDMHYVTTRRIALLKLRDMIGPDAFASGEAMPYVPDWRFARLP